MSFKLYPEQYETVLRMKNGCILNGDIGSGKTYTSLGYYYVKQGGSKSFLKGGEYVEPKNPKKLYVITTAHVRDTRQWQGSFVPFLIEGEVDSWNNIKKYVDVKDAFFIFDEQKVVGYGEWTRSFLKIVKNNDWILLSATPGDDWCDYIPVFIANGFYRNKTDFERRHVIFSPFVHYRKIDRYLEVSTLEAYRDSILIDMEDKRHTVVHDEEVVCDYDIPKYKWLLKEHYNPWTESPMLNASELCQCLRRCCNEDVSRQKELIKIHIEHPKLIVFYNYDYELDILKGINYGSGTVIAEWNGHKHEPIPNANRWIYLVQYKAGAEGWNCIETNAMVFYSMTYSYKDLHQAKGRINRLNTPFIDLYYYSLTSRSSIDRAVKTAIKKKKMFNTRLFCG